MKNNDVIKRLREKYISNWMIDDGNNRLLWKDKAPTPNEVIDFLLAEIKREREDTSTVTRFEVIDETGRAYVRYDVAVSISFQDNDQTLKVFIKPKQGESEGV